MGTLRMASKPAKRPKGNDSYADVKRALERRTGETGKQRQRAFGGIGKRAPKRA
jgi:hypothetical protein